jgi:D-sedoheptulose 7-phosphate isomerase
MTTLRAAKHYMRLLRQSGKSVAFRIRLPVTFDEARRQDREIRPVHFLVGRNYGKFLPGSYLNTRATLLSNLPQTPENPSRVLLAASLAAHLDVMQELLNTRVDQIAATGQLICDALNAGGKILLCGNGGSAADAQHIAAELVGRYERERRAFPAISLTTDTSALTALSNDYGYEAVFARQVLALAVAGDVLIAISTSGKSANIIKAADQARTLGCKVIALTGCSGEPLASHCDLAFVVPSERTSRVQEAHITIGHLWCEMVDAMLSAG